MVYIWYADNIEIIKKLGLTNSVASNEGSKHQQQALWMQQKKKLEEL